MLPTSFFLGSMRIVCGMQGVTVEKCKDHIPKDTRTVLDRLNLHSKHTAYVCCPKCFYLYDLDECPEFCTNKSAPQSNSCDRRLLHTQKPNSRAARRSLKQKGPPAKGAPQVARSFLYQDFKDWLAWMHNRPEIEPHLQRPFSPDPPVDGKVNDIWDSDYLRNFLGPDGQNLFLCPDNPNENRLVFNLNEDGFNPYGNRIAGKRASVGGLYLVCLNLPPSLRFKPENIFLVGIIPGPKEPSFHQINYLLRPLVDDLVQLWKDGIFVTRTRLHPHGRLVRAALVALVCDMPAARLLGGFAHYGSDANPCSMCRISGLNNLDPNSFIPRTNTEHRCMAQEWLAAETEKERDALYHKNGVRWSELLRLEYWDPVQNTVVDPMHGFYLRILQRHCRDIWGMSVELTDCDGLWELPMPNEEEKAHAWHSFRHGNKSTFSKLKALSLRYLAIQEGLDYRRNAKALREALLEIVSLLQFYAL